MPDSSQSNNENAPIIDGIVILRTLYDYKWWLLICSFLVAVLTAGYTLTLSNTYESTTALVIREPEIPIEGEAKPLTIEMLQKLTQSTEVKWELFVTLNYKDDPSSMTFTLGSEKVTDFTTFQARLSTSVETAKGRLTAGSLLPMLTLEARAKTPLEASTIANLWAEIIISRNKEIYTQGAEESDDLFGKVFESANQALAESEAKLSTKTLAANEDINEAQFTKMRQTVIALEAEIFDLDISIEDNTVLMEQISERLRDQEDGDKWIGTLAERALRDKKEYTPPNSTTTTLELVQHIKEQVMREEVLLAYRTAEQLELQETEVKTLSALLNTNLESKEETQSELILAAKDLATYTEALKTIPEKQVMNKAITNDALWNAYMEGRLSQGKELTPLKTESPNPLHEFVSQAIVALKIKIESLGEKMKILERDAIRYNAEITSLTEHVDIVKKEINRQQVDIDDLIADIKVYRDDYNKEKNQFISLRLDQIKKKMARDQKALVVKAKMQESEILENEIAMDKLEIAALNREVQTKLANQARVATEIERISSLKFAAQQASRNGTAILYKAQANPLKAAPARTKMVLTSAVLSFLCFCFLIVCRKLILEN